MHHLSISCLCAHTSMDVLYAELVEPIINLLLSGVQSCDAAIRQIFLDQLWVIASRADRMPRSRKAVVKMWCAAFQSCSATLTGLGHNDRVRNKDESSCTLPGCKTSSPATAGCSRCKTPYCSRVCQNQYVPSNPHVSFVTSDSLLCPGTGKHTNSTVKSPRSRGYVCPSLRMLIRICEGLISSFYCIGV